MTGHRRFRTARRVPGVVPAALTGGASLACGVALTALSGWLVVAASLRPPILTLMGAIVGVRAFGLARPVLRYRERLRSHDAALVDLTDGRVHVFDALVPLAPGRLGRTGRGEVLAGVVDDLDDVAQAQVRVVVPLVSLAVAVAVAAVIDALVSWDAGLVVVCQGVASLLVGLLDGWWERRGQRAVVTARGRVADLVATALRDGAEVSAIGGQAWLAGSLAVAQRDLSSAVRAHARGRACGAGLVVLVTLAHAVWMALLVAPLVGHGLPRPLAAALVLTPVALGDVVAGVPDAVGSLVRARASGDRLDALLATRPSVAGADVPPPEGLSVPAGRGCGPVVDGRGLAATWDGTHRALDPTDVLGRPGEVVSVVGPSGSGKSTLLAVLARNLDPDGGTYVLDGRDALAEPPAVGRRSVAVVDDEVHVFASTVRENLRLARPEADDDEIVDALVTAGLGRWFDDLPSGLDELLGTGGRGLSGGERARLGIARAVLSGRPLVLLDEPVAHLDDETAAAVLDDLGGAVRDRCVVLVTHRPEALPRVDRLVELAPVR